MKRIVLLGASGSIGLQTVDVIRQHPDLYELRAYSVGKNIGALRKLLAEYPVDTVCVQEEADAAALRIDYPSVKVLSGDDGLLELSERDDYDVLVNALVGYAGFAPTMSAIKTKHDVALANKETLVVGGELVKRALRKYGVSLYPIDSEHSAVFQCLQGNKKEQVKRLIITASGGSFRNLKREELKNVTVEQALAHPNWSMGPKITIDSATMMNKGFEVMEAHWLFDMPYERIDVLMHQESVIHSMVEYIDHSVIAQLGAPDMRLPIQYALSWPERLTLEEEHPLDLAEIGMLHFAKADTERFPLLAAAYDAGRKGGNLPAVMNAANEAANLAFRNHEIGFLDIEDIVIGALRTAVHMPVSTPEDLEAADAWGWGYALERIEELK